MRLPERNELAVSELNPFVSQLSNNYKAAPFLTVPHPYAAALKRG